jgi:hypothetical protein
MTNRKITHFRSLAGGIVLAIALLSLAGAAPAVAGSVWWDLSSDSLPAVLPSGGEGTVVVFAENRGYTRVASGELTVTDRLPAGVTPQRVELFLSTYVNGLVDLGGSFCTITGQEVVCRLPESVVSSVPFNPYDDVEVRVPVKIEGAASGVKNEMSISSAGAPPASVGRPLEIGSSPAPFGISDFEFTPEDPGGSVDTQAGSHPFQLTSTLTLNQTSNPTRPAALPKDLYFKLPAGLIGNPTILPQCTSLQFSTIAGVFPQQINACPADTAVGVAAITFAEPTFLPGGATFPVPLFNLTPSVGEPARFGFLVASVPVILDTSVRTGGDYGVTVTVKNISELANFIGSRVTFWGVPGDPSHDSSRGWGCIRGGEYVQLDGAIPCAPLNQPKPPPFLNLPTSCTGPLQTTVESDSWSAPNALTAPVTAPQEPALDGCNRLPFSSSISVVPDGQAGSTPTGLTVGVHVPQEEALNPTGLAPADVKDTTVALPAGVALNPAGADGLLACSLEQIALQSHTAPTCPEASKVGTVEIQTPLLPNPLTGAAYLAAQSQNPFGSLVALYIVAQDPVSGVLVKLAGEVKPDPVTGQLVSTFLNTPQLPFEDLKLHFFGGSRAPLATPAVCGSYTTTASIQPWSGNEAADSSSTFQITSGPGGGPCASPLPFNPELTAGSSNIQAGAFTPFTMTMSREDGQQSLQGVQLKMPLGLSGTLSTVKLCGEAQANAGTCGPESLIGETIVSVGVGGSPFSVRGGKVYITGPYRGAPFGLSIVNPAKAGPFDLGQVVVRATIDVNEETAALTVTTDTEGPYKIPTIIDGIPLQIKHINVLINRPNFTFNATDCNPLKIGESIVSTEGASSALQVPYQVTNCAVLAFKPKLGASVSGKSSRANGVSFHVKLGYPAGPYDANIARVKVELPKAMPSRLSTLQKACAAAVFEANPANCPAASIVGHATATTPVLPVALTGPAYFVSHGGAAFPGLIIVLQGYGVTVHLVGSTFISKAGITSSTFETVPDVPVGTFELTLPQGPYSALTSNTDLCRTKLVMPTEFVGQNGALIRTNTKIAATGCPKHKAKKAGHGRAKRAARH